MLDKAFWVIAITTAIVSVGCASASENKNVSSGQMAENRTATGVSNGPLTTNPPGFPGKGPMAANANAPAAGNVETHQPRKPGGAPAGSTTSLGMPAADNSMLGTDMGPGGAFIETRVFRSDSDIAKVHKIINGPEKGIKIFLKNGRVVKVAFEKVPQLNIISLAELKALAGIKQPVAKGVVPEEKKPR